MATEERERYDGRLVTDGNGHLYAHGDGTGEVYDEEGNITLEEVTYDPDLEYYVFVQPGEQSHNERHASGSLVNISGTTGPLYDNQGMQVVPGDPHHNGPTEDDPHFDENSPNNTKPIFNSDEDGPTVTGHTQAYTS